MNVQRRSRRSATLPSHGRPRAAERRTLNVYCVSAALSYSTFREARMAGRNRLCLYRMGYRRSRSYREGDSALRTGCLHQPGRPIAVEKIWEWYRDHDQLDSVIERYRAAGRNNFAAALI